MKNRCPAEDFNGKSTPSNRPPKDFGILTRGHFGRLLDPVLEQFWAPPRRHPEKAPGTLGMISKLFPQPGGIFRLVSIGNYSAANEWSESKFTPYSSDVWLESPLQKYYL